MFKAARWRSDRNKIKVVFRLQFQATQVPLSGAEAVTVSLVPLDVGKPTVRSERASAVGGTCNWSNPIYETVKLVRDPKTGNINEKFYKFLVSAGGPAKAGLLGEATINLAEYVEVSKASSVSLPLKAGALLHVTIQRIEGDVGGRDAEGNGHTPVRQRGTTLLSQLSKRDDEEGDQGLHCKNETNLVKDGSHVNRETQLKFQSSRNLPTYAGPTYGFEKSCSFDARSVTSSDNSSELYPLRESSVHDDCIPKDLPLFLSPPANVDIRANLLTSSGDLSETLAVDRSTDGSTNSSGESGLTERLQSSGDTLEDLRNEVAFLTRKFEVSELELQTLRKQVVKESRRGQYLSKEVSGLKEERDALQRECEQLKLSQIRTNESESEVEDSLSALEDIKQELDHEKNVNLSLRLQLQKTQEANSELLLAVRDLDDLLDQKNREIACHDCSKLDVKAEEGDGDLQGMGFGNGLSKLQQSECNQQLLEQTFETDEAQYTLGALVKEHNHMLEYSLEKKIIDLNSEIDLYKKDREDLEMQMEQLALDYEILKQENHDVSTRLEQAQLREQLRMQYECSAHTTIISDLETHVEGLEKELQTRAESFESDIDSIMKAKIEQEKKALQADEALRETKWNSVSIAERLREELTKLSSQASSIFHDNEKIVKKALKEASELRLKKTHLEKMLEETKENLTSLRSQYHKNLQQLIGLLDFKSKEADNLKLQLKNKNGEFDNYKMFQEAKLKDSLEKIQLLEAEIEKLKMDMRLSSEQKEKLKVEIETLETTNQGNKMMLQNKDVENEVLRKEISLLKQEVEKSLDEIKDLNCMGGEKENMITRLNTEVETLGQEFNNLKQSLSEGEQEKEKLRRLVSNLTGGLLKEEDRITRPESELGNRNTNEEKHYHERSDCAGISEFGTNGAFLQSRGDQAHNSNGKVQETVTRYSETHSEEQGIVTSTFDQNKVAEVYGEMALLKVQNEQMEADLKEMQERYSEISLKFAEVEGERQQLVMTIRTLKNALKN